MSEESLLDTQAPVTPAPTEGTSEGTSEEVSSWRWAEGVAGEGDRPEWFNEKYDTVENQAQGYNELASKFGSFRGSPQDDYKVSFPTNDDGDPLGEFAENDPMIASFKEQAKEMGMNQEGFTKLLHSYVNWQIDAEEASRAKEVEALGPNRDNRIKSVTDWGKANLSEEQYQALVGSVTTADSFNLIESLIDKTREKAIPADVRQGSGITEADLAARIADPRYATDYAFQKETTDMFRKFAGDGEHNVVRG